MKWDGGLDKVLAVEMREVARFEYVLDKYSTGLPSVGTVETLAIKVTPGFLV